MGGYGRDRWRKNLDRAAHRRRTGTLRAVGLAVTATTGLGSLAFLAMNGAIPIPQIDMSALPTAFNPACDIKGNISIDTGERIYHVPGQMFYDETKIRSEYGERWFCSEAEARAAGWRKSRR